MGAIRMRVVWRWEEEDTCRWRGGRTEEKEEEDREKERRKE